MYEFGTNKVNLHKYSYQLSQLPRRHRLVMTKEIKNRITTDKLPDKEPRNLSLSLVISFLSTSSAL